MSCLVQLSEYLAVLLIGAGAVTWLVVGVMLTRRTIRTMRAKLVGSGSETGSEGDSSDPRRGQ